MTASNPYSCFPDRPAWFTGFMSLGVLTLAITSLVWLTDTRPEPGLNRLPGARLLADAEMRQVTGGWLEPKARKPRTGCQACQVCQAYSTTGRSPDAGSPSLDVTSAEVADQLSLLSVGGSEGGLDLKATYSSHLADGTNTVLETTMGAGWMHGFSDYVLVRGSDYIWVRGDGEIVRFTRRGAVFHTSTGQFYEFNLTGTDTAEARGTDGTVHKFRLGGVAWPAPGTTYVLEEVIDRNLRTTNIDHSGGLVSQVTGPYGHVIDFAYDGQNRLVRLMADGRATHLEYSSATGQVSSIVLPNGERVEYTYNFRAQLVTKVVPGGRTYRIEYDAQGRAHHLRDEMGATVADQTSTTGWAPDHAASLASGEMQYVPGGVSATDGRGNMWRYDYDARGCITRRTDPDGGIMTIEYDGATLLPSRVVDENLHATEYEYDARGNRTLVRDAEGNETRYEYDPLYSRVTKMTEPDGDEWRYIYDSAGNLIEEVDPLHESPIDATIRYTYDSQGLRQSHTDRNGNTTTYAYDAQANLIRIVDPAGAETTYTYDAFGNRLSQTMHNTTGNQVTTYTYDARDRVVTMTDPVGTVTKYDYDAAGNRVRTFTDWTDDTDYRRRTDYEYDHRGRLTQMIDDIGGINRTMQYQYDGNDNRTVQIDPNGVVTQYTYDSLNRLTRTVLDPGGLSIQTRYEYDAGGNRISEIDPNGHTTTYLYDALDRRTHTIDPLLNTTENRYFAPGGGGGGCACGTPGSSSIHCTIDAEGKVTRYEYDKLDRRIKETRQVGTQDCDADPDSDDAVTSYQYDPNGNLLATTDPNGNTTTSTYTVRNEVATSSNGAGETTAYLYDAAGNRTEIHPPNGNVLQYTYDAANRLTHTSDTLGAVVTYTYDAVGNQASMTDALGHATTYVYDALDRLVTRTDPMGHSTTYEYDAVGNRLRTVDREGNQTNYEYDAADRRIATRVFPEDPPAAAVTRYEYDDVGNVTRIVDANGNATQYQYDDANRRSTETYADGTTPRYTYDDVGNVRTREDHMGDGANPGNITTYTYDDLHRTARIEYANGEVDEFTYDAGGRMLSADNAHSHVGFTYDTADRVLTNTQTDLPQTYSHTLTYAHDVVANTRSLTYPSGKQVTETRDLRDRLASVVDNTGAVVTYAYDLAGRVLTKTFGNGTQSRYDYNDNNWTTELRHVAPDTVTTFAGFAHDYDLEGNPLSARNLQTVMAYDDARPVTHSEKYAYDDTYRLLHYQRGQWVAGDIPTPRRNRTWEIDRVHNWTAFGIHDLDTGELADYCNSINQMNEYDDPSTDGPPPVPDDDGLPDDFGVNPCVGGSPAADFDGDRDVDADDMSHLIGCRTGPDVPQIEVACQIADLDGDADVDQADFGLMQTQVGPPGTGFNRAHDKNGSLVSDDVQEYYYDYQTSMSGVLRAENRLTMVKEKSTGTVLSEYRYDALGRRIHKLAGGITTIYVLTHDWREIEEYENGALARIHTFGGAIDERLTMDRAVEADRFFYHDDVLFSTLALTDGAGGVAERYAYDAYGSPAFADTDGATLPGSAFDNESLFTGRRYDRETGLYCYRTRHLEPGAGRFTTRDTIGIWGDGSALGNGYSYVGNRPYASLDPLGTWELRCRPLDVPGGGALPFAGHCWVVCDGNRYSLLNKNCVATKLINDDVDKADGGELIAKGDNECETIKKNFEANKKTYPYDKDQCNSNWFANQLLKCSGIELKKPTQAWGWDSCSRPGIDFTCAAKPQGPAHEFMRDYRKLDEFERKVDKMIVRPKQAPGIVAPKSP